MVKAGRKSYVRNKLCAFSSEKAEGSAGEKRTEDNRGWLGHVSGPVLLASVRSRVAPFSRDGSEIEFNSKTATFTKRHVEDSDRKSAAGPRSDRRYAGEHRLSECKSDYSLQFAPRVVEIEGILRSLFERLT